MVFKIKRRYLLGLGTWLQNLSLQGQESRNRTKFVEMLEEEVRENESTRLEVLKKYAKLDEKGELVLVEDPNKGKHYDVPEENMKHLEHEIQSFLDQEFECGGPGLKTRLLSVKNTVLNTSEKIEPQMAVDYDIWCTAFEEMQEE